MELASDFSCILNLVALVAGLPGRRRPAAWLTPRWLALLGPRDLATLATAGWTLLRCTPSQVLGRWMSTSLPNSDGNSRISLTSMGLLCTHYLTGRTICFVDSWFIRTCSDDAWCMMYGLIFRYNFDPANDCPLPGRFEWVKLDWWIQRDERAAGMEWNSLPAPSTPPQRCGRGAYRRVSFVSAVKKKPLVFYLACSLNWSCVTVQNWCWVTTPWSDPSTPM
jgi:hypothetical protein